MLAAPSNCATCDDASSSNGSCSACSDAVDLQRRVGVALDETDGSLTEEGRSLRGIQPNVLTTEECQWLVDALPPRVFIDSGDYESTSNKYTASRTGYAGLTLPELALDIFSEEDYQRFLAIRERVRAATEQALNLCPGTLQIDFTTISQKTPGGTHRPHADNCFHFFRQVNDTFIATPEQTQQHSYANRVAASILYLNDRNFKGGT